MKFKNKLAAVLLAISAISVSCSAQAKLCSFKLADGKSAFKFVGTPTKTMGSVSVVAILACKDTATSTPYATPNPQNDCEKAAVLSCEPSFGGLPICTTNNFANFCGFCFVTTKVNSEDVTLRYINGQVYDGSKSLSNTVSCPAPKLVE